MKTVHYNNLI